MDTIWIRKCNCSTKPMPALILEALDTNENGTCKLCHSKVWVLSAKTKGELFEILL